MAILAAGQHAPLSAQVEEHIRYLDLKIGSLNKSLEQIAGGVLDDRDAAADLRDRLQRELDARETP